MKKTGLKELPIGRQTFSELIEQGLLYVDKTQFVWKLVSSGKFYFLSRPRRFGKSLLLSTIRSFFEGKSELFRDLYLFDKVREWTKYPVVQIDYSLVDYRTDEDTFKASLLNHLNDIAREFGLKIEQSNVYDLFVQLIKTLHQHFGPVVILIDEYDKPLVDLLTKEKQFEENREILKWLYGSIKGLDPYLRFVMLTGVSRFSKVGVFSGMNNLDDISLNAEYSAIVGFSQVEMESYFSTYIDRLALKFKQDKAVLLPKIKQHYNGFSWDGVTKLYNPFSLLKLFNEMEFGNYWFSTGTPSFLIDLIKVQKEIPQNLETTEVADLVGHSSNLITLPIHALLFQTGYLTIRAVEYDDVTRYYQLGYPNWEVQQAFTTYLLAMFTEKDEFEIQPQAIKLRKALHQIDIEDFIQSLKSFLSFIPSRLHIAKEAYYHSLFYMLLTLTGFKIDLEKETDNGRMDAVLELNNQIYIVEFKLATSKRVKKVSTLAQQALKQIENKKYYQPYLSDSRKVVLLGIGFLEKELDWKVKILP